MTFPALLQTGCYMIKFPPFLHPQRLIQFVSRLIHCTHWLKWQIYNGSNLIVRIFTLPQNCGSILSYQQCRNEKIISSIINDAKFSIFTCFGLFHELTALRISSFVTLSYEGDKGSHIVFLSAISLLPVRHLYMVLLISPDCQVQLIPSCHSTID